jgi:hypothetical protein
VTYKAVAEALRLPYVAAGEQGIEEATRDAACHLGAGMVLLEALHLRLVLPWHITCREIILAHSPLPEDGPRSDWLRQALNKSLHP